jgi:hypothetical protein
MGLPFWKRNIQETAVKIVSRTEFMNLPAGTIFNKFSLGNLGDPCIKGETWNDCQDFLVQYFDNLKSESGTEYIDTHFRLENGEEVALDFDCLGRDGCFDQDQLFAVWSDADVAALIHRLQNRFTI